MAHRLTELIARLVRREDLSRDEAEQLLESLLDAEATDAQIAAVLVALAAKGETAEELTWMAAGRRARGARGTFGALFGGTRNGTRVGGPWPRRFGRDHAGGQDARCRGAPG